MKTLFLLALPALALLTSSTHASDNVSWSVSIGAPAPVYVAPVPTRVYNPQVVYEQAPIYTRNSRAYAPAYAYVEPRPVVTYTPPRNTVVYVYDEPNRGHRHHRHHGRGHGHGHDRDGDYRYERNYR